jgi:galactosyl transferase GMA12/MNN10 family
MTVDSKVLVFSIALEGYEHLFRSCIETQAAYCKRHQYEYVVISEAPRRLHPTEAAWLKVPLMKSALAGGYEWVAFIDADCDIRAGMPDFVQSLDSLDASKSIFMAPGFSGRINSGVIFAKRSPAALAYFDTVITHADDAVPPEDKAPYENGHMIHFGKNNPAIYLLDHNLWNNNSELEDEIYIQHYSGGNLRSWYMENRASTQDRINLTLSKFMKKVKGKTNSPPASQSIAELMPFYQTHYPAFREGVPIA